MEARQGRPLSEKPLTDVVRTSQSRRATPTDTGQVCAAAVAKERRRVAEILGTLSGVGLLDRSQAVALADVLRDPTANATNAAERFSVKTREDAATMGRRVAGEFNRRRTC